MTSNRSIERHFSRAARAYHDQAQLQRAVASRLAEEIERLGLQPRRILDIGCATGFLTAEMARRFARAHVVGIDIAPGMIAFAREEFNAATNIELLVADAHTFESSDRFDLVVSSSTLQWLRPYDKLFAQLKRLLVPHGHCCMTAMLEGTLGELHALRKELCPDKLPRERLPQHEEISNQFEVSGFRLLRSEIRREVQSYSSVRDFLNSIRAQGFTGGPLSQGDQPLCRGEIAELIAAYQEQHGNTTGQIPATFCYGVYLAELVN